MSTTHHITEENLRSQNFRPLHAGDDYDHKFTVERPPGTPLDLTGASVWFTVKADALETDAQAKLQLNSTAAGGSDNEIEITDPTNGVFFVKFRGAGAKNTADLEGKWKYDIQVRLGAAPFTLITVATGYIEFLENITRTTT